jgi:hypothetical protein
MKPNAWHLVIGLTLWFAWFCATYGGLAVACAVVPPLPAQGAWTWLNASVLLLAAVVTAAFGVAAWASARAQAAGERQRFMARAGTALYATAALSTAVVALPAVLLAPCI